MCFSFVRFNILSESNFSHGWHIVDNIEVTWYYQVNVTCSVECLYISLILILTSDQELCKFILYVMAWLSINF